VVRRCRTGTAMLAALSMVTAGLVGLLLAAMPFQSCGDS
jgi:hypothetical protein